MAEFENYMSPGRRGHLVGIGGVSMSSLAEVLYHMGLSISGSDTMESQNVRNLRALGISVAIGHRKENVADDVEFIVRTAAVHDDNAEIRENHHNFNVYAYSDGGRKRPDGHDRRHAAAAEGRPPDRPWKHDRHGSL